MNVRIDGEAGDTEGLRHNNACRFMANPRKSLECIKVSRDLTPMLLNRTLLQAQALPWPFSLTRCRPELSMGHGWQAAREACAAVQEGGPLEGDARPARVRTLELADLDAQRTHGRATVMGEPP